MYFKLTLSSIFPKYFYENQDLTDIFSNFDPINLLNFNVSG